jgi:predicted esterase
MALAAARIVFFSASARCPMDAGLPMLFVDSRGQTWDGIRGGFGPDVDFLDGALEKVFGMVAVDPNRLALGGFSDGATYALSLGLVNGDLFPRIVAFSPGFPRRWRGPRKAARVHLTRYSPTTFCRLTDAAA